MQWYRVLHRKLSYLNLVERKEVGRAYFFAKKAHALQSRASGEEYITHPVNVALILAEFHLDYQTLVASLLHDVVEDTSVTAEELELQFGYAITLLVNGVTKISQIEQVSNQIDTQAQSLRKMILAMAKDIRVIIIKLADRLHNMRTLSFVSPGKRQRIARETLNIYAPIAHRLGMYELYAQLEDLAFISLYPHRYHVIEQAVTKIYGNHQKVIKALKEEVTIALKKQGIPKIKILSRTKHLYSIYRKMLARKIALANIMDIYGLRIIVPDIDDCYRALGAIHGLYKPIQERFKDYIAAPKANGYQSIHTVLFGPYGTPVEFQIRTESMDQFANSGIAAHWRYKEDKAVLSRAQNLAEHWANDLLELQHESFNSQEFLENVRLELYPDTVFIFTPKGKIVELNRGATAVDFAYAIHTDIGNSCTAVRINRQFAPLSTVLHNGDIVSIITTKGAEPSPNWLTFVTTARAKHNIRAFLRNQKRSAIVRLGSKLLVKACAALSFDFAKISLATKRAFLKRLNLHAIDELYENIGTGNLTAILVAYKLINFGKQKDAKLGELEPGPLVINTLQNLAISCAHCCYPLPKEPISGYLNHNVGLDLHTQDCPVLQKQLAAHPERELPVTWGKTVSGEFKVALSLEIVNQIGALATLTKVISQTRAAIDSIHSDENSETYAMLDIVLRVKNLVHLQRIRRHLSKVSTVIGIVRKKAS